MHGSGADARRVRSLGFRDRIVALADAGSVRWLDVPRPSPHLARFGIAPQQDDGVVTAAIRIDGIPHLVAAQDERFLAGSVGAHHAIALRELFERACRERPGGLVVLAASGGVRLHEANAGELELSRALRALLDARMAGVPCTAVAMGDVFGGASVLACACDRLAALPQVRIGLSGPKVIEAVRGREELDASDGDAVAAIFGAQARAASGALDLLRDDTDEIRNWVRRVDRAASAFPETVIGRQLELGRRLQGGADACVAELPPLTMFRDARRIGSTSLYRARGGYLLAPLQRTPLGPAQAHAIDAALLEHVVRDRDPALPLLIVEDCIGHEAGARAERLFVSQFLAQHAAMLALVRRSGRRIVGLLAGLGHSAAFFVNALQADAVFALPASRVEAMSPGAIQRVTGVAACELIESDPLLGQPVRHLAALGGAQLTSNDPSFDELIAADRERTRPR